jgi:hypothetical protein
MYILVASERLTVSSETPPGPLTPFFSAMYCACAVVRLLVVFLSLAHSLSLFWEPQRCFCFFFSFFSKSGFFFELRRRDAH